MEEILLWKKTKTFFGFSIILNIITEKWGYIEVVPPLFLTVEKETSIFGSIAEVCFD
jgi:hypothetical protein